MRIASLILITTTFVFSLANFTPAAESAKRPNILFVFADDWGRYASILAEVEGAGSMNDLIRTPNIDRVAREGVLFRRAFVNAPSCTPCRSSLLSGQYFWRTGRAANLSGAVWDPKIPSFPLLLHDAGYHIGQTHKVWSPGTPNDAPFGGERFAYEKAGGRFNNFSENVTAIVEKGRLINDAKEELYREVDANFEAFLADRKSDQPFCYWFGPTNVHRQWVKGSGKALWNLEPDSLKGKLPKFLPDVAEVREDIADYFGEIQALDQAVGRLLARVEKLGELDKTLVVISGDHGPPGFTHGKCNLYDFGTRVTLAIRGAGTRGGRVVDDFVNLMDLAPTLLEIGGVTPPEAMTGRSLVSVLRSEKSGQVDPQRSFVLTGRERHVDDARDGHLPYPQRAIRTNDFAYIHNFEPDRWPMGNPYKLDTAAEPSAEAFASNTRLTLSDMDAGPTKAWLITHRHDPEWQKYFELAFAKRPSEQLFELKNDPDQLHNVADDPKFAAVRDQLQKQLLDELTRTGDPRVTDDRQFFEKPPMAGPLIGNPKRERARAFPTTPIRKDSQSGGAPALADVSGYKIRRFGVKSESRTAQAVMIDSAGLVHTRQFLPLDESGNVVGKTVEIQFDWLLKNLGDTWKDYDGLTPIPIKMNFYVVNDTIADEVRQLLSQRWKGREPMAISFVQTRLSSESTLVALDAVAAVDSTARSPIAIRAKDSKTQTSKVLPLGPRVYISGQAEKGVDLREATSKTMQSLKATLQHLDCDLTDVVQVKSFLTPMSEATQAEQAIIEFFAPNPAPPLVFVEWQSSLPIEIELIAAAKPKPESREPLEFITPPGMTSSPVFCRVVRVNDPRTIFISGLFCREKADGAGQVTDIFDQLQETLKSAGSDLRHLTKATYYVSENDASTKLNELRSKYYDGQRPPSASKAQVTGVGVRDRSITLDMIAVPAPIAR